MKKFYYCLALAIIIVIAGKSMLQAITQPLTKKEEKKALLNFIDQMQEALDKDDEQKAEEIIKNAKATIPSFSQIDQTDKDNTLQLLERSLALFHPIQMVEQD